MSKNQELVREAIKALKIKVPVMRSKVTGNTVKLWLYGRGEKPVTWTKKEKATKAAPRKTTKKPAQRSRK
jgi:hypothetical protein